MNSSLFVGLFIGMLAGLLLGVMVILVKQRKQTGSKTVKQLQQEHQAFQQQVSDHFVDTAELVNRLTDSYKEVFDHLQTGAQTLVDPQTLQDKLPGDAEQTVTLTRIGSPKPRPLQPAERPAVVNKNPSDAQ